MKLVLNLIIIAFFFPVTSFATLESGKCSSNGYTVATINGVLTNDKDASDNMIALRKKVGIELSNQAIDYQFLLNPIHLGGLGDIFDSVYQKAFENEVVADYDLIEMLKDASQKVKTQKLLLVAHSQGNFYANSFYDVVTTQTGGVPTQSIGVYSVATPSGRVVDNETRWLTSETDKVIAWVVGNVPFRKIMPPNVLINLEDGDNIAGHGFSEIYLKYSSKRIVEDTQYSLNRLSKNTVQDEDSPCISPPKSTMSHKVEGVLLAVSDPILNPVGTGVVWTLGVGVKVSMFAVNTGVAVSMWTYNTAVATTKWTYNTSIAVAVWSYDTSIAVAKTAWGMASAIGSFTYNVFTGALSNGQSANNNSASAILATLPEQDLPIVDIATTVPIKNQSVVNAAQQPPQTVFVFEPKVQTGTSVPKLVFVGSFPFDGGSPTSQILGTQATAAVAEEVVTKNETVATAGAGLPAPAVSAPQCSQTLATDGCLLATTTVHFEWSDIAGASYYLLNKNGNYATTTEKSFDIEIKDFSDYILEVVAVALDGQSSATSSQKVSVATIPIAINEIAWMGTVASPNDEWFEIKNNTGHTIDLSQWELNAKDNTPYVKLTGTIAPHAYLVFERTTKEPVITDVEMHQKYSGALGNSGEQLNLSYASTTFDKTPDGAWVAGATSTRQTMERYSSREPGADPENWGTNLGYIKNGKDAKGEDIEGTPGEQNSVSTIINKGQDITSDFTLTNDEERYVVPDGMLVTASSTFTIEPGVTISFLNDSQKNNGYFIVKGEIIANGTPENPVVFNSFLENRAGGFWIDNNNGTSTFENSHFEDINNPVAINGGNLEIRNSQFINTDGGVESYGANTTVLIENTYFASSTSDTIGVYGSSVHISSSTITNQLDGDAIGVYIGGSLVMTYTTIDGVADGSGIYSYDSILNVENSTIRNTEDTAMSLTYSTTTISNTVVQGGEFNDGTIGVEVYGGTAIVANTTVSGFVDAPGVGIYKPTSPVIISGGEITGNAIGVEMSTADAAIMTDVSVHDNGTGDADNVVVW